MPKITNKKTGKTKTVTEEGLKVIQENPLTANLYTYSQTEEPKEVTDLKATETEEAKASKNGTKK